MSIRGHRHYQAGTVRFGIFDSDARSEIAVSESTVVSVLNYPALTVKVEGCDMEDVFRACAKLLRDLERMPG